MTPDDMRRFMACWQPVRRTHAEARAEFTLSVHPLPDDDAIRARRAQLLGMLVARQTALLLDGSTAGELVGFSILIAAAIDADVRRAVSELVAGAPRAAG